MPPAAQKMTRAQMEATLDAGHSVLHAGHIYTSKDTLPTEADLAGDDAEAQRAARANLLAQQRDIQAQLARLPAPPEVQADSAEGSRAGGTSHPRTDAPVTGRTLADPPAPAEAATDAPTDGGDEPAHGTRGRRGKHD